MKLRSKPKDYDGVLYDGNNAKDVAAFAARHACMIDADDKGLSINTSQGMLYVGKGFGLVADTLDRVRVVSPNEWVDDYEIVEADVQA